MKKLLMIVLAVTMFAGCGKDDEKEPNETVVLTNPTAPYLLYWDGERMQVGRWGTVTQNNILFTEFGSAVAFTATSDEDIWDAGDVKFNPTATSYEDYETIPCWNGTATTDGYISSAAYHTLANVRAGRGDICKLAGLTKADIDAGVFDNESFRLPTNEENVDFTNTPIINYSEPYHYYDTADLAFWGQNGTMNGGWFPIPGDREATSGRTTRNTDPAGFLPAAGCRVTNGPTYTVYSYGYYWSSRPNSDTFGYNLIFNTSVFPSGNGGARMGFAVRCVPR